MHTGFIYKIVADDTDKVYYGSTTTPLNERMCKHKSEFKRGLHNCSSREMFNYLNTRIELLETHYNVDKDALKKILVEVECGYIERFRKYRPERCVNKNLPNRTADKDKEYRKKYNIEIVDEIKEHNHKYYIENVDKIKELTKRYRNDNADKIKERRKQYYDNNKEKIKQINRLAYLAKKNIIN